MGSAKRLLSFQRWLLAFALLMVLAAPPFSSITAQQNAETDRLRAEELFQEAKKLSDQVFSTRNRGLMNQAKAKFEESLAVWRTLGKRVKEREILCQIGALYLPFNEMDHAREFFEQALALIEGDEGLTAVDLHNLGFLYQRLGDPKKSLPYYQKALQLRRLNQDRLGEGETLDSIGQVYRALGELHQALEHNLEGLQIFRQLKRRHSESIALGNIANLHHQLGEPGKAIEYAQLTLAISRETNNKRQTALTLHNLGVYHLTQGNHREALDYLNQALEVDRLSGNVFNEAHDLSTIGRVYVLLKEYDKALGFFNQAIPLHQKTGNRVWVAGTLTGVGSVHEKLGDLPKAIASYEEALTLQRLSGDPNSISKTLHALAGLQQKRGDILLARQYLEEAINLAESVRSRTSSQQSRSSYLATKQFIYEAYTDLLMQMSMSDPARGYDSLALQNSERARARSLLDLLAEARSDLRQGVDPSLLAAEKNTHRQLDSKAEQQAKLFNQPPNEAVKNLLIKEIEDLTAQLQQIEGRIRATSPRYAALVQPQSLTAAAIQSLLDENTVLLEYGLGEKQSWLWALTRDSLQSYKLPPRAEIETTARQVYELLTARQPRRELSEADQLKLISAADDKLQTQTTALSRMLLSLISTQLQQEWKGRRLVIVAAGVLEYLPFAALPLPESGRVGDKGTRGQEDKETSAIPLIANHEVVNLPSASVLALIRREASVRNAGARQAAPKILAVLADPVFETSDPRLATASKKPSPNGLIVNVRSAESSFAAPALPPELLRSARSFGRDGFGRLIFSGEEAEFITRLAPRNSILKATGFQASRALAASSELGQYRVVHFATHGLINSEHPELSGLVLSLVDENGKPQDGFLRMHEIFNLQLPADLVVLSACQTALGKEIKGEGLVGLTRGFMYAGAQRVVASLWQVDDQATALLMQHFYRGMLKENLRPAAALRAAQLEMSRQKRWSSPYYWAGFVIQGEYK